MLKEKINADLKEAMLARDAVKVSALRMLKTAVMKFEVSGEERKEAKDEDIMVLIKKELKSRKDSIEQFKAGGREDLVAKEEAEIRALEGYLPKQMSEDEVRAVVKQVVAEMGVSGPAAMGKVMGACMGKLKGQADGTMVNGLVKEILKEPRF